MNRCSQKECDARKLHFLLPSLDTGGGEKAFLQIAECLSRRGYSVVLHSLLNRGDLRIQMSKGLSFKPLCFSSIKHLFPGVLLAAFSLAWVIKKSPDSVFISTLTGTNLLLLLVKTITRAHVPVIIVEASTQANRPSKLITWLMRFLYPKADSIVSVSDDVHRDLSGRLGNRLNSAAMTVIPNPVEIKSVLAKAGVSDVEKIISEDPRVNLLFVGRLTKAKGLQLLINAFASTDSSRVAKLVIVGDGELAPKLKGMVSSLGLEKSVFFTGRLSNPYPYFDAADVFILSSLWEGQPLVLLEAMAMKVPKIILSDCSGSMSEKLGSLKCVDVFSSGNIASLSLSLQRTLCHKSYPKSDYSAVLEPYFLENVAREYEDIIEKL